MQETASGFLWELNPKFFSRMCSYIALVEDPLCDLCKAPLGQSQLYTVNKTHVLTGLHGSQLGKLYAASREICRGYSFERSTGD